MSEINNITTTPCGIQFNCKGCIYQTPSTVVTINNTTK